MLPERLRFDVRRLILVVVGLLLVLSVLAPSVAARGSASVGICVVGVASPCNGPRWGAPSPVAGYGSTLQPWHIIR
jgi:hypothetical protein